MIQLIRRPDPDDPIEYPDDVAYLHAALNGAGYDASDADIQWAWRQHSDEVCASWLVVDGLPAGDTVDMLLRHLLMAPAGEAGGPAGPGGED